MTVEQTEHARSTAMADDETIRQLIETTDSARRLEEFVAKLGLTETAAILVDEVLFRCSHSGNNTPVTIELHITRGDERAEFLVLFPVGEPVRLSGKLEQPVVLRVEYDVLDLARELYGPVRERAAGVRTTRFPTTPPPEGVEPDWAGVQAAAPGVVDRLLEACSSRRPDLGKLAVTHHSDKWGGLHWFTPHYERHLRDLRDEVVTVLEIGIGGYRNEPGGGSLDMWKHYFHRGQIYGMDIFDKPHVNQPRVRGLIGDQNDPEYLRRMAEELGPFDVIIDDGSHINEHVHTSFRTLLPYLRPGGYYVIEDLWTSFCPGFGGVEAADSAPSTSLGLLKSLVDGVQYEERPAGDSPAPSYSDQHIVGVHVYHNIAFLEKGTNAEGGIPPFIPRSFDKMVG